MNDATVQPRKSARALVIFIVGSLVLLAVAYLVAQMLGRAMRTPQAGMALQSPEPVKDFSLTSHDGKQVSLSDFRGKVVLMYFGYTTCPDVCPTTLAEVHGALKLLGNQAKDVQLLMISVDPERDTKEVLKEYMTHFDPSFIGLTGTPEALRATAVSFGVHYEKRKSDSALGYLVDHTATLMLVDRGGHLKLVFPYGTKSDKLANDLLYALGR